MYLVNFDTRMFSTSSPFKNIFSHLFTSVKSPTKNYVSDPSQLFNHVQLFYVIKLTIPVYDIEAFLLIGTENISCDAQSYMFTKQIKIQSIVKQVALSVFLTKQHIGGQEKPPKIDLLNNNHVNKQDVGNNMDNFQTSVAILPN